MYADDRCIFCRSLMASTSTLPFSFCAESSTTWPSFSMIPNPINDMQICLSVLYMSVPYTGKTGGGGGLRFHSVCQSICLSVHSVSVHSVFGFRTFLSRPLIHLLEVLYKYLSWCSTSSTFVAFDQLLRELLQEARYQCPLPSLCFFEPIG